MPKTTLRPLRLIHLNAHSTSDQLEAKKQDVRDVKDEDTARATRDGIYSSPGIPPSLLAGTSEVDIPLGEAGAQYLLKRTPHSYLLNQAYQLWYIVSLFFFTVILTHKLSTEQYAVFAIIWTALNTIAYIVAFGLEDATNTFVPRVLAEHGKAAAALLIRRLLALRMAILTLSIGTMIFALPVLAALIAIIPINGAPAAAAALRDPSLLSHITPIAFYTLGNGISGLLTAVCAARMRMRLVFVVGSLTQLLLLGFAFLVLQLGWGVNGILWLLAISSLFQALALAIWLAPLLFTPGATYKQPMKPVLQLGISAWLTNLVSGALLKQVSIILLGYFAISLVEIGYFNLSYQLAHAASLLLVTGFGGVGVSALAAAFVGQNYERLARSWQSLIKIETLLATPILIFCLFNAQNIAHALYGSNFDPVGPLLAIFLFFNILSRVLGTTIHQSALYVIGKSRLVVLSQWVGLVAILLLEILLIPHWGPAGALVADGLTQLIIGGLLLAFLWPVLPRKYPLGFTLRMLIGLTIAALPSILWHPQSRILLGVSGTIFLCLSFGLFLIIRPLNTEDVQMVASVNPRVAKYLRWFTRRET